MRRLLLLVMMCVCVPIGALAAVYEMTDYNSGTVVATLSVDGGVATIEFTGNGDVTNFNMDAMGNTLQLELLKLLSKGQYLRIIVSWVTLTTLITEYCRTVQEWILVRLPVSFHLQFMTK